MKPYTRCCTVSAVLSLAGCANTQQVMIEQPEGYRAAAYVVYDNQISDRCRASYSFGAGHWIYIHEKERRLESPSTGPVQFKIPDRVHRGLCTQYLQRLEIETTPEHGGEPIKLARLELRPSSQVAPAHEVRLNCNDALSLDKTNSVQRETWCWPHEGTDMGRSVTHVSSASRLTPLHVRLELPAEPGYWGQWIRIGDQHIPYKLVHERPGMSRVALVQIHRDGLSCNSHPACEHGIEASKVIALAVLNAKVTNTYWAHSGPDSPAIFERTNASDWVSEISNKLYRWKWHRQDQMNFLLRTHLYATGIIADPAWEPMPGEAPEAHFKRCKQLFESASYEQYLLNKIKSEMRGWIASQTPAVREGIFNKQRNEGWIDKQVRDLQRWRWSSRDWISFLLTHRATGSTRSISCEPLNGEEPDQHFRRCQRVFGPTPKQ